MNRKLVALFFVLAAAVIAGIAYYASNQGWHVQAAHATRGDVDEFVDERGKTRLPEVHRITMPFAGRIQAIDLNEGQPVTAGQIVARVSQDDLDHELAEAQAVVDRLHASIRENNDTTIEESTFQQALRYVESMRATVSAANARKRSGQKRLDYAETNLARVSRLFQQGAKTQDDLDLANVSYVERDVDYQQDVLVAQAMSAILSATELLPQMVQQYIARKGLQTTVLEKQTAEAEARLQQVMTRRERGMMRSPVDGVVLERPIQNEQYLTAGTVLLTIGRLDELEVEADILSQDVVDVRVGDHVEIYGPAMGQAVGSGVAGTVHRIFPAGFTKISSLGVEQQRVKVVIHFADGARDALHDRELGVDYRVRVRIVTDSKSNALTVPRSALFRSAAGNWQVFAIRNRRAELQTVEVGLMNDQTSEITAGLDDQDIVVLAPDRNLQHGTRVSPLLIN